jgi:rubrerythrin
MRDDAELLSSWVCQRCEQPLAMGKTKLNYLGKDFEADLMRCPVCGAVFVGESLALGKMLEVEKSLEDK